MINKEKIREIFCFVFDDFETLDLMGPVEFLGQLPQARLHYVSQTGGFIRSRQGFQIVTEKLITIPASSILLIVGGQGTRKCIQDTVFIETLSTWVSRAEFVLTVCTGSALLAQTGVLDGLEATSNKLAFDWVCQTRPQVNWRRAARWVREGKYYTSSGVSAGMDMVLGFIADHTNSEFAESIAKRAEYLWHSHSDIDPFCTL